MLSAIIIDLWDRIYTQNKLSKPIISHKMRITINKVLEYWRFSLVAFLVDVMVFIICVLLHRIPIPVTTMIFVLAMIGIEFKSLFEHAKERRSNITDIKDLVQVIVTAATDKDARKAIKEIGQYLDSQDKK